nr:hypothetical protein Iba_chr12cCG17830 [Ipomoea batatas]
MECPSRLFQDETLLASQFSNPGNTSRYIGMLAQIVLPTPFPCDKIRQQIRSLILQLFQLLIEQLALLKTEDEENIGLDKYESPAAIDSQSSSYERHSKSVKISSEKGAPRIFIAYKFSKNLCYCNWVYDEGLSTATLLTIMCLKS